MGSGKTTVGRLLAATLGWRFADLDLELEASEHSTVQQIFASKGEVYFRAAESELLDELLRFEHVVLALGGGTADAASNRRRLQDSAATLIVHLHVPFEVAAARSAAEAATAARELRPLFTDRQLAAERFGQRAPLFQAIAHCSLDTAARSPAEIVDQLLPLLEPSARHLPFTSL